MHKKTAAMQRILSKYYFKNPSKAALFNKKNLQPSQVILNKKKLQSPLRKLKHYQLIK